METLRTFVALMLPDEALRVLGREQQDLAGRVSGVKWAQSRTIHLTLAFLGSTQAADIEKIGTLVRKTACSCGPIPFTLEGIGAFPNTRSPKVVWAGMRNCDALLQLQQRIADGLEAIGYQKEKRRFRAHVTLGRVRDGSGRRALSRLLDERRDRHYGEFLTERLAFVHSDLQPTGPVYTVLEESKL